MQKQPIPPEKFTKPFKSSAPSIFQKIRGLQQYQRQQNYHNTGGKETDEAKDLKIEDLFQFPAESFKEGFSKELEAEISKPDLPKVTECFTKDKFFSAAKTPPKNKNSENSPCQSLIAELSSSDMDYLFQQSNATLQTLLLRNASRQERNRILAKIPRKQRSHLMRSWAENTQKLDSESFVKAFHWLRRRAAERQQPSHTETTEYPEIRGAKVLSTILDALPPEKEIRILNAVAQGGDAELSRWLERDRGSVEQRRMLRQVSREASDFELAVLFAIPHYGRLLRHLLSSRKKLDVLYASIDLAQLPQTRRKELQEELFRHFPFLQQ